MSAFAAPKRQWTSDTLWNVAAFGVTAAVGLAVQLGIVSSLGAAALGVFALLYAVHVVGAQLAVLGVHDSVQKHVAEHSGRGERTDPIVVGGLLVVLSTSAIVAMAIVVTAGAVGRAVGSADVGRGLYLVAPGVLAFAVNKVLFGAVNGRGRLKSYAGAQIARAVLVLAALCVLVGLELPVWCVGGVLPAAELALIPLMLWLAHPSWTSGRDWLARHLGFGAAGALNGILLETHLRVDVIVLSFFVADSAVGTYAFAALFAEGLHQVAVVIRSVAYPTLVQHAAFGARHEVTRLVRRLAVGSLLACAMIGAVVWGIYPLLAHFLPPQLVADARPVLLVLLPAVVLYGAFVPFDQLLLQSGFPGKQSALMACYVATNVVLNLVLVPRHGLSGAAVATACSFAVAVVLLLVASWKWLGYRRGVLFRDPQ